MDPRKQRCPYQGCKDCGRVGGGNVVGFGVTYQGRQRFLCHTCERTFCETAGSLFYRLRSERKRVVEALQLFAQGWQIPRIAYRIGVNLRTIKDWLTKACSAPRQDACEELGLTQQQMDNLRARFAKLKRRRSPAGGRQTIHNDWCYLKPGRGKG